MKKPLPSSFFAFVWHFLRKYRLVTALYTFMALAAGLWGPFNSLMIKSIIDHLPTVPQEGTDTLLLLMSLIVLNFLLLDNVTWRSINMIRARYTPRITNEITQTLMTHVLAHSHGFFQNHLSGKIAKQINSLSDSIDKMINYIIANFLRGASLLLTALITAYVAHPIFCMIMLLWFVCFASVSLSMSRHLVDLSDKQAETEASITGELVDTISNQHNVRLFAKNAAEKHRLQPFLRSYQQAYYANQYFAMKMYVLEGGLIAIMMALCGYALVQLYTQQAITIGDFALIFGLTMETGHMMWWTLTQVDEFNQLLGKCKRSLSKLMAPISIQDRPKASNLHCQEGSISFEKVGFSYPGGPLLFEQQSLLIRGGEKVGLVGYSGGGKSTFINLILRLYDVQSGQICIDGQAIHTVRQDSLRSAIAVIPQDPSLFNRSLLDNIRYARPEANMAEVVAAAKQAGAHDFIRQLTDGYETLVGERGIKLSGGQRARIAIARAALKNAAILILDEATSQLDSITEKSIQDSMINLMQNRTTLVIAHRLSTLLQMDRILVFDRGRIIESGSHVELIAHNGLYRELWDAQVGGFIAQEA